MRRLEIGPGPERLEGYETLNVVRTPFTDYVGDATKPPFKNATFDEVYSSHCIEHIEWYDIERTLSEWVRILKPGGILEVHTVDGYKMMRAIVDLEEVGDTNLKPGAWKREWHQDDPYKWAVGRVMSYSKRNDNGVNLHRAILTPSYMLKCFENLGLINIERVEEPKGSKKHPGINLGLRGTKPGQE